MVATAVLFHRVLLEGAVIVGRDALRVSIPLYEFWAEQVRRGVFPEWYPADAFGQSYIGMLVSSPFHPAHLLALVMSAPWAVTLAALLCYPLAASGAAALARRLGADEAGALLAGATFGFCGYLVSVHDTLPYLLCIATAPWALAWLDRFLEDGKAPHAAAAASLWALCLFSGDAQGFLTVGLGLGALALWRRKFGRAVRVASVTALLAAPQWVTAALVGAETARGQLTRTEVELWSMHPWRLLELVAGPLFFAQPGTELGKALSRQVLGTGMSTLWASSLAVAPVATVLAALAWARHRRERGARILAVAAALTLWLALGKHLGASRVLSFLPFRYPEKWMPWFVLCLALGAALGAKLDARRWFLGLAAACSVAAIAVGWAAPSFLGDRAWLGLVASALSLGLAFRFGARPAFVLLSALPSVLVLQLADPSVLDTSRGFSSRLDGQRAYRLMGRLEGAAGDPARLATALVDTLDPVARRAELANNYLPAKTAHVDELVESPLWLRQRLYRLGSVRYLSLSQPDLVTLAGLRQVAWADRWKVALLEDATALPRAYLAQPVCVEQPRLFMLAHPSFDPSRQVLLTCPQMARPEESAGLATMSEDRQSIETSATGPMVLVVTEAFARGWEYTVDGVVARVERGNLAFQAVRLPAGDHHVTRRYRTPGLAWGGLLFALGVLSLAVWWRVSARGARVAREG